MLKVIGIGPGRSEWLPPAVGDLVNHCDVLIGGSRALELFPDFPGSQHCLSGDLDSSLTVIKDALLEKKVIGVLVSGDPGFFSLLPRLKKNSPRNRWMCTPELVLFSLPLPELVCLGKRLTLSVFMDEICHYSPQTNSSDSSIDRRGKYSPKRCSILSRFGTKSEYFSRECSGLS